MNAAKFACILNPIYVFVFPFLYHFNTLHQKFPNDKIWKTMHNQKLAYDVIWWVNNETKRYTKNSLPFRVQTV